mmetsp:Transcript_18854/g.50704  ORF Transcript_18854/g.50704 Transcript_18854/m.50704 type:complete len:225 (+) Transcript_18854:532-1206(+)
MHRGVVLAARAFLFDAPAVPGGQQGCTQVGGSQRWEEAARGHEVHGQRVQAVARRGRRPLGYVAEGQGGHGRRARVDELECRGEGGAPVIARAHAHRGGGLVRRGVGEDVPLGRGGGLDEGSAHHLGCGRLLPAKVDLGVTVEISPLHPHACLLRVAARLGAHVQQHGARRLARHHRTHRVGRGGRAVFGPRRCGRGRWRWGGCRAEGVRALHGWVHSHASPLD